MVFMFRFPDASYVSSKDAWLKLQKFPEGISKDTADYEYTDPTQLRKLNKLLENEGEIYLIYNYSLIIHIS